MIFFFKIQRALVNEILKCDHLNKSYWSVTSYSTVQSGYNVASVDQLRHSNVSYCAILSFVVVTMPYKVVLTFDSVDKMLV